MNPTENLNAVDTEGRKTGPWSETDAHGGTMSGEYRDGARVGIWRHRAGNGRLRSEGGYHSGDLHGPWIWYRANGALLQKGGFENGDKHGLWERWDANGKHLDATTWGHGRKQKPQTP